MPSIPANAGLAKAIRALQDSVRGEAIVHMLREGRAAVNVLVRSAGVLIEGAQDLTRTNEVKLAACLLYGAAHARSLPWQFASKGLQPHSIELQELAEYQYLDAAFARGYNNRARRVGHAALTTLTYDFLEPEAAQAITEASYVNLEFLNTASEEEALQFVKGCALARREQQRDGEEAFQQYLSLLRGFMPNARDYY